MVPFFLTNGKNSSPYYLEAFDKMIEKHNTRFDDPRSRENNLEYDLLTTDWILAKVRESESYAQNLYAALCNNDFQHNDVWPILKGQVWGCSWRSAGGIIADMRQEGDYLDWYCTGIRGNPEDDPDNHVTKHYVSEGTVTDEVCKDLFRLGWLAVK
jgi:hypothetical protein